MIGPVLWWLLACVGPPPKAVCESVCDELVVQCDIAAYPSSASCVEGCLYDAGLGAPIHTFEDCVADAQCDEFTIVQCSRAFGGEP